MRQNMYQTPLALPLLPYFILLLSSFFPLNAAMSVSSSIHIKTARPVTTISLTYFSMVYYRLFTYHLHY